MDIAEERINYRKKCFKRGIDMDTTRDNSRIKSLSLRKTRREEKVRKRRYGDDKYGEIDLSEPNNFGTLDTAETVDTVETLDQGLVKDVYSDIPNTAFVALEKIRKILSQKSPPTLSVVRSGVIPKLVEYLTYTNHPSHQYEAAWALTNIISGDSDIARAVIDRSNIGSYMIELLNSQNIKVRDQAAWCLSNIAGECISYRDELIRRGCLSKILLLLDYEIGYEKRRLESIRTLTWAMQNLTRGSPKPPFHMLMKALPVIKRLYEECWDEEVMNDTSYTLMYITNGASEDQLRVVFNMGVITRDWMNKMSHGKGIARSILRTCGNIIAGPNDLTQHLIDWGILTYLSKNINEYNIRSMIGSREYNSLKETCWILSNITAGTVDQIQGVINYGLIPIVIDRLTSSMWAVKKECIYVLSNLVRGGTVDQISYLIDCNGINSLCQVLGCGIDLTDEIILCDICKILNNDKFDKYRDKIEECGGLDKIEHLQNSKNEKIYSLAVQIIEEYFEGT